MAEQGEIDAGGAERGRVAATVPKTTLPQNGLTRYLRVRLEVADGVVRWEVPRAILGLVPVGVRRVAVPVAEVVSVRIGGALHPLRLLAGAACIAVPFVFALWWYAAPMVLVGAWSALVSFGPQLEMATAAGTRHRAAVCFGHRFDAELYLAAVTDLAAQARSSGPAGRDG